MTPPRTTSKPCSGVWVSSSWSLGKIVDAVADLLSVPNFNNAGHNDKLKLFRSVDGGSLCEDMSVVLKTLLDKEEVFNGDNLILEYVGADVSFIEIKVSVIFLKSNMKYNILH